MEKGEFISGSLPSPGSPLPLMQIVALYFGKWHLPDNGRAPGRILGFGLRGWNPENRGGTIPGSHTSCLNILPSRAQLCFIYEKRQRAPPSCGVAETRGVPFLSNSTERLPRSHLEELWFQWGITAQWVREPWKELRVYSLCIYMDLLLLWLFGKLHFLFVTVHW